MKNHIQLKYLYLKERRNNNTKIKPVKWFESNFPHTFYCFLSCYQSFSLSIFIVSHPRPRQHCCYNLSLLFHLTFSISLHPSYFLSFFFLFKCASVCIVFKLLQVDLINQSEVLTISKGILIKNCLKLQYLAKVCSNDLIT